jgi:hypothetical protein
MCARRRTLIFDGCFTCVPLQPRKGLIFPGWRRLRARAGRPLRAFGSCACFRGRLCRYQNKKDAHDQERRNLRISPRTFKASNRENDTLNRGAPVRHRDRSARSKRQPAQPNEACLPAVNLGEVQTKDRYNESLPRRQFGCALCAFPSGAPPDVQSRPKSVWMGHLRLEKPCRSGRPQHATGTAWMSPNFRYTKNAFAVGAARTWDSLRRVRKEQPSLRLSTSIPERSFLSTPTSVCWLSRIRNLSETI